jgi:hypothetical protein
MSGEPTIEKKTYTEEQAKRLLLAALRGKGGQLTKSDAVALSGLPVPDAEQALKRCQVRKIEWSIQDCRCLARSARSWTSSLPKAVITTNARPCHRPSLGKPRAEWTRCSAACQPSCPYRPRRGLLLNWLKGRTSLASASMCPLSNSGWSSSSEGSGECSGKF